ncbi:uncharacterized protein AC631_02107 [Debaryomyces fabryi]|uniref:Ammonia transport outward protein 2 n=1 Tax=Debaryomyces fabryi TaxID=58627 RepID=A0A0V1Q1N0_9ASCO|nr:uncharacterized protein AC631_02107 [Debaryomyces fabryi]KSA02111.1 hypothetical protein AC631_02107 [Debaryomyces fabryi]CUM55308.1 unnamed protein product [Debaryomyces fabryi]
MTSTESIELKGRTSHESYQPNKVSVCGDGDEFIIIGDKKFYRHELMTAFGGTLNPDRYAAYPVHEFGNAAALGLAAFGLTTFVLGLYYTGAMGIEIPNVVVGLALFYAGTMDFLTGIWELVIGNTFAGTVLTSYGSFWFAFATLYIEAFGIAAAYKDEPEQFANGVGLFLIGWFIFTMLMTLMAVKSTVMFLSLFVGLDFTFLLLAIANFTGNTAVTKAGGVFAIIAAVSGWWCAFAGTANKHNSYFTANPITLPVFGKNN